MYGFTAFFLSVALLGGQMTKANTALSSKNPPAFIVSCYGPDEAHPLIFEQACQAVQSALGDRLIKASLHLTRVAPFLVEGYLQWVDSQGDVVQGPPIQVDAQDSPLNTAAFESFAKTLLQVSNIQGD